MVVIVVVILLFNFIQLQIMSNRNKTANIYVKQYITSTNLNSAFCLSGVGKSSTGLSGWGYGRARSSVSGGR